MQVYLLCGLIIKYCNWFGFITYEISCLELFLQHVLIWLVDCESNKRLREWGWVYNLPLLSGCFGWIATYGCFLIPCNLSLSWHIVLLIMLESSWKAIYMLIIYCWLIDRKDHKIDRLIAWSFLHLAFIILMCMSLCIDFMRATCGGFDEGWC